jgi:hypothetical protein
VPRSQGCQIIYFHSKATNFGIFWKAFEWKIFGSILWTLRSFFVISKQFWYSLSSFGRFPSFWCMYSVKKNLAWLIKARTTTSIQTIDSTFYWA